MSAALPCLYLARHGQTEWSLSGRHTGRTDLPLTAAGETEARELGARMRGIAVTTVFCSPLQRARRTCQLAGFDADPKYTDDLLEWNYGDYEGRRTQEILAERPGWDLFKDGCPGGESPSDIAARADRLITRIRTAGGSAVAFSSGHISRILAVRWLDSPTEFGARLALSTASFSVLSYGHDLADPVIQLWNDTAHLTPVI